MLYERTIEASYKKLREMLDARYFVQWETERDPEQGCFQIVRYCVRERKTWATVFTHESETVCRKVCQMLNENEEGANKC
jgi:hypothetical protein